MWEPNPERHVTGYLVSWGTASGVYEQTIDVGNVTTFALASASPTATYYFVVTAYDSFGLIGKSSKEVVAGAPPDLPITVVTRAASPLSTTAATLNGSVNPQGSLVTVYFEYGSTNAYGGATLPVVLQTGFTAVPVNSALSDLRCDTQYHYRAVASTAMASITGANGTFMTTPCPSANPATLSRRVISAPSVRSLEPLP